MRAQLAALYPGILEWLPSPLGVARGEAPEEITPLGGNIPLRICLTEFSISMFLPPLQNRKGSAICPPLLHISNHPTEKKAGDTSAYPLCLAQLWLI